MPGRFTNTAYSETVNSLLGTMKDALKNNYYKYSDKQPTPVEYFHINKQASTLDEGSKLAYNNVGDNSPFWFNQIHNMLLYGIEQIQMQYSSEDFGIESAAIEGEAIALPNTIVPYPDDQFCITYLNKQIVFKVTHVDPDTLEDGSNIYKLQFRSSTSTVENLLKQVIEEYTFVVENVGTEMNPLIKSSTVSFLNKLDEAVLTLKQFYKSIFYSKRVQTFVFSYTNNLFYDPYLIEFLRKNKILDNSGEYIYIQHQTTLSPLFAANYSKTFFSYLERRKISGIESCTVYGAGRLIEDKFSIFINRLEDYWEIYYDYPVGYEFLHLIPCFTETFVNHIAAGHLLEQDDLFYNIIIKYLHEVDFNVNDLKILETIPYENCPKLYYAIPCLIYCLESYIKQLSSVENEAGKHSNKA